MTVVFCCLELFVAFCMGKEFSKSVHHELLAEEYLID